MYFSKLEYTYVKFKGTKYLLNHSEVLSLFCSTFSYTTNEISFLSLPVT